MDRDSNSRTDIDRLSALLERFRVRAKLFHNGPLCGITRFAAEPDRGFLHVMRRGEMLVSHHGISNREVRIAVREPSLVFYPRPLEHAFHNAPTEGADFVCATLAFDGGAQHPLARALPPCVILPLARVDGLEHSLALLFAETERVRCGQRLMADRIFDVLLVQLLRWLLDNPGDSELDIGLLRGLADTRIARVLTAVHEAPGSAWSLDAMAGQAGMSRSAFAVLFRERLGTTPADYLLQWRLAIAQSELRQGRPIKTIAARLGYANASALSRAFAQKLGQSPRQWLARIGDSIQPQAD